MGVSLGYVNRFWQMDINIALIVLVLVIGTSARPDDYDDYYQYLEENGEEGFEELDCADFLEYDFRCIASDECKTNELIAKTDELIAAQAELSKCPIQDLRAGGNGKPGQCCHERNIKRDCSDPE